MQVIFTKPGKYRTGISSVAVVSEDEAGKAVYSCEAERANTFINAELAVQPGAEKPKAQPKKADAKKDSKADSKDDAQE